MAALSLQCQMCFVFLRFLFVFLPNCRNLWYLKKTLTLAQKWLAATFKKPRDSNRLQSRGHTATPVALYVKVAVSRMCSCLHLLCLRLIASSGASRIVVRAVTLRNKETGKICLENNAKRTILGTLKLQEKKQIEFFSFYYTRKKFFFFFLAMKYVSRG